MILFNDQCKAMKGYLYFSKAFSVLIVIQISIMIMDSCNYVQFGAIDCKTNYNEIVFIFQLTYYDIP